MFLKQSTNQRLTSNCGAKIPILGTCDLNCSHKTSSTAMHKFYIVDSPSTPIISNQSSISLDLVKLILNVSSGKPQMCIQDHYKKVFDGISRLEAKCNIHLKDGSVSTAYPARRVGLPEALKDKLLQVLIQMEKCPYYPIPNLEDATSKHYDATVYSKLDAKFGYWLLILSQSASYTMRFGTIYGRFWRMSFGIISAQDEFQRQREEMFQGLEGFAITINDILVFGRTTEEHNERLKALLE
ncbi:hypothetical protein QYM36_005773 [Artemia franciscana]|uniref:Uncharacterized protein n=1 Tax=Artemia franciscana TaxID=6661 RepID=A0AA88HYT6_ARTSF|nr:hypothetical protein QYM36_005773 [Artemia franciscana]